MVAKNFKDLTGQKFGKLTVLHRCENDIYGRAKWFCKCDCGGFRKVISYYLTKGTVSNCGCRKRTKPLTIYRKIKLMTVDEMAEFVANLILTTAEKSVGASRSDSEQIKGLINELFKMVKQYLLQKVEE